MDLYHYDRASYNYEGWLGRYSTSFLISPEWLRIYVKDYTKRENYVLLQPPTCFIFIFYFLNESPQKRPKAVWRHIFFYGRT